MKSLALKVLKMRVNDLEHYEAFATADDRDDVDVVLALVPLVFACRLFENVFFGITSSKSTSQTERYYKHSYPSVHLIMRLILHKCVYVCWQ